MSRIVEKITPELTEEDHKEIDRITNLSRKELNVFGITDEQIDQSIKRVKARVKEYIEKEKKK